MVIKFTDETHGHLEQLQKLADRSNLSLDDLLRMLVQNAPDLLDEGIGDLSMPGSGVKLAQASDRMNFRSGQSDIVKRSREILENEFAEELFARMKDDAN